MWRSLRRLGSIALSAGAVAGTAYLALALRQVMAFSRRRRAGIVATPASRAAFVPPITIIKPLYGLEPELAANLASFCNQDYPLFQVIFCATDPDDPAVEVARSVAQSFPTVDARVIVADAARLANPKIANVQCAEAAAKYDLLAISDADMRVDRDYLRAIAAPFADAEVGAVTCLYGAVPQETLVGALGAMFVNDHFAPSVLVAGALEPLRYCFGSTMAVRRSVLARIGGLHVLGASLADDHTLGREVAARGLRVALAPYLTRSMLGKETLRELWRRELRWARIIRSVRPIGSTLAVVTYVLPIALAAWLCHPRSFIRNASKRRFSGRASKPDSVRNSSVASPFASSRNSTSVAGSLE